MGFTKTFPYDIGTFVLVDLDTYDDKDPKKLINRLGTITCYQCATEEDAFTIMVYGYKNAWCGEYLINEIRPATEKEVNVYRDIMNIEELKIKF